MPSSGTWATTTHLHQSHQEAGATTKCSTAWILGSTTTLPRRRVTKIQIRLQQLERRSQKLAKCNILVHRLWSKHSTWLNYFPFWCSEMMPVFKITFSQLWIPFIDVYTATRLNLFIHPWFLRQYTDSFASKIKSLYPVLVTGAEGVPEVNPKDDPCQAFDNLVWSTWGEARLIPCLKYIRGNRHLVVPDEWRAVFPKAFEVLHKLECKQVATSSSGSKP